MSREKRLPVITWMQLIGCILVIFGHSYPFVTDYPRTVGTMQLFVYGFHMPMFVFCSGVLLVISKADLKYSFGHYLNRRGQRLLLPYLVFSLLGVVPKMLLSPMLNDNLSLDFMQLLRAFLVPRENIWGHFWFLPMIFACAVFGYWVLYAMRCHSWVIYVVLVGSLVGVFVPKITGWFALNDLLHYAFYYFLGMSVASFCQKKKIYHTWKAFFIGLEFVGFALFAFFFFQGQSGLSPKVQLVTAVLMIAALYLMLQPVAERYPIKPQSILSRSYSVFILSWPCQLVAEIVLERILHLPWWCIMPPVFLTGVFVPCLIIKLVDRIERNSKRKIVTRLIGG